MQAWLDENCGADGWAMAAAGLRGVVNDAVAIYFLDASSAAAFVCRWCAGSKVAISDGAFQVREDQPTPRVRPGCTRRFRGEGVMEIEDINEADPRRFLIEAEEILAGQIKDETSLKTYVRLVKHLSNKLNIPLPIDENEKDWENLREIMINVQDQMAKMRIDIAIERNSTGVALDNPWRDKIHSYVAHIRQIVNNEGDLPIQIKEEILRKLHAFDAEVDRARTRIEVFSDAFVRLCEGLSAGAKALGSSSKAGRANNRRIGPIEWGAYGLGIAATRTTRPTRPRDAGAPA